jgi:DNA-directed RNA polymerase specialized sigma24 family protein
VANKELNPKLQAKGGASDLAQQTFLEVQRDFARFHGDSEDELLAWMRRLLLHNLADFKRCIQREVVGCQRLRFRFVLHRRIGHAVDAVLAP